MQNHLIIFIKNPIYGTVKTRLAASIGHEKALEVYGDLLDKCREECKKTTAIKHLYYSQEIVEDDQWSAKHFEKELQVDGNLGDKMAHAFQQVFAKQGKVVIIGSDCYDLSAEIIEKAFEELNKADVVLGPANDGGYYLLGIKKFYAELFEDINWSTSSVLAETIKAASAKKLSITLLEELIDLDTIEDLEKSGYQINLEVK